MNKKLLNNMFTVVATILCSALLGSCGSGSCSNGGEGNYNLVVDNTSPVPLINSSSQQFYVYMTNVGNGNAHDLSWNIVQDSSTNTVKSLWGNIKSAVGLGGTSDSTVKVTGSEIKIIDSSNCINVNSGVSCRILLQASDPSSVILQSTSKTSTSAITQNVVSAYGYTPSYSAPEGTLTLSPLSPVNYGNGFASYTFFIINNSPTEAINLDQAPFGTLPAGINYSILAGQTCPNPLPAQSVCQVRMTLTSPKGSVGATTPVTLTPTGTVVGGNVLPTQQPVTMTVTNEKLGNVDTSTPIMNVDANSTSITTAYAYISNTGSGPLSLGSLSSSNSLLNISSDQCSNQTLLPGAVCRYQLNIDPTQITSSGSAAVSIPYNDGKNSGTNATSVSWVYSSAVTPAPGITLTSGPNLSQINPTTTLTIINSGNVVLRNFGNLVATPTNPRLSIVSSCGSTILVGESCNYALTYAPSAPSETETISLGGITANYIDSNGVTQQITLPSTTSVNLSSTYQGLINPETQTVDLNATTPNATIIFKNIGNYKATLSGIAVNGANLLIAGGTCVAGDIAPDTECTVVVALQNSTAVGSGNGNVTLTYNNNNGTSSDASVTNINWLIGAAPSLSVNFGTSNLVAVVGSESTTSVRFSNNGNTTLSNITLPTPPTGFSWQTGVAPSCVTNNTQTLNIGDICNLTLKYAPSTSISAGAVTLGSFSATTSQGQPYTSSNPYTVSATAVSQSVLSFSQPTIIQGANWTAPTAISTVVITNTDSSPITITNIATSGGLPISISGCSGEIQPGSTCTLTVNGGPYTANGSGSIIFNYSTPVGAKSQALPLSVDYQAQPIITPGFSIGASPSGTVDIYNNGTPVNITLTLTNATTVANAIAPTTDGNVQVLASSLLPTVSGFGFVAGTGGSCSVDGNGYITIGNQVGSNNCTYIVTVTATAPAGSPVTTLLQSKYRVQSYGSSTTPSYGQDQSNVQIPITVQSVQPTATLSSPALITPAQANALQVEMGIASPVVSFSLVNNGLVPINGAITAPNIPGMVFDMSACNNLGAGSSCTFTAQIPSTTPSGLSGNLNTQSLLYNNGITVVSANFPSTSIPYSVNAPNMPIIATTTSVSNCQQGDGSLSSVCLINTGNPAPVVTLTYTNSGSGDATNFNLNSTDLATLTSALSTAGVYTLANNCVNANLAKQGGTCTVVISPVVATASASASLYDLTVALGYSYNYGISSQLQEIVSSTSIALDVYVADPTLTVGSITSIASPGSATTTVTLSNWYGSSLPASPTLNITLSSNPASGITASACTWTEAPPSGATCTTTLTNDGTAPGGTYQTTATSAGITSSDQSFVVANPIPAGCADGKKCIFVTNGASNAALGGFAGADDKCKSDSANPLGAGNGSWKALLWGNNSTTVGTSYYQVNGSTVTLIATATSGDLVGLDNAPAAALTIQNRYTWVGATGGNCGNWTSSNAGSTTSVGNSGAPNAFWSNSASTATSCAYTLTYLYCVQQ